MKKLLFVLESLDKGGAEKVLTTIIKKLDKKKFEITVLLVTNTGVYIKELSQYCKIEYMLPDYNTLNTPLEKLIYKMKYKEIYTLSPKRIYSKYVKGKYDVEIAFVEGFATKFVAASTNQSSRKICWIHIDMINNAYADQYFNSVSEQRKCYNSYDKIVCVSNTVKKVFEKKFSISQNIEVIYNPIDIDDIKNRAIETVITQKHKVNLITIGRLEMQKGYDRLIQAISKVDTSIDYHLWILGEGSERNKLQNLIENKNLTKKIELLGFVENPYKWINIADAFICSSRAEGFSLVVAEAMVLGKPIFSVECAGPNELLDNGKYGIMVPNSDEALLELVSGILNEKYDFEYWAKKAIERNPFFDLQVIIDKMEQLFLL